MEGCIAKDISGADMLSSELSDHQLADLFLSMQLILGSPWKRDTGRRSFFKPIDRVS
jgi:hypothetical protein